jgi:hypothetical protein
VAIYNKIPNDPNDIKMSGKFIDINSDGTVVIENNEGKHSI